MIENSKEILYLVIAFAVLIITFFFIWIMYYIAMILKQAREMVTEARKKVEAFGDILNSIKEKMANSATILTTLAKGVKELIGIFKERGAAKEEKEERKIKKVKK